MPVRVPDVRGDGNVARRAGHEDRRDQRERGRDDHQHHDVMRLVLAVVSQQHLEGPASAKAPGGRSRHGCFFLCSTEVMRPGGFEPPTRGLEAAGGGGEGGRGVICG